MVCTGLPHIYNIFQHHSFIYNFFFTTEKNLIIGREFLVERRMQGQVRRKGQLILINCKRQRETYHFHKCHIRFYALILYVNIKCLNCNCPIQGIMLIPIAIVCQTKSPMPDIGYLPPSCWSEMPQIFPSNNASCWQCSKLSRRTWWQCPIAEDKAHFGSMTGEFKLI